MIMATVWPLSPRVHVDGKTTKTWPDPGMITVNHLCCCWWHLGTMSNILCQKHCAKHWLHEALRVHPWDTITYLSQTDLKTDKHKTNKTIHPPSIYLLLTLHTIRGESRVNPGNWVKAGYTLDIGANVGYFTLTTASRCHPNQII